MKYLAVNPFNPAQGNGVNSYYQSLRECIPSGVELVEFGNTKDEDLVTFRSTVLNFVTENFGRNDVVIEAPETRAATLLLDRGYRVHVRLHTPLATCHKYEGKPINQARFSEELRVIAQANVVSAPSYGIAREIGYHLDTSNFTVNKNPIFKDMPFIPKRDRQFDVIFMGRMQKMKGAEFLEPILAHLPPNYRVAIVGAGATKYRLDVPQELTTLEHIEGDARFELLADSRVCIVPSLFENCSMMMLEAIASGVPVVAWKRGGNDEFPRDVVRTIEFDQVRNYSGAIIDAVEEDGLPESRFEQVVSSINDDFRRGVENVVDRLLDRDTDVYKSPFVANKAYAPRRSATMSVEPEAFFSGKKILGFTISNEHIEEMWAPILHYLGVDYRLVSKRPLGFHSKFSRKFPVNQDGFRQYDWISNPKLLIDEINRYRPHALLTHNGSHPMYQHVMEMLKDFNLPILYSELGWFPQDGNVYIDRWGVNGGSSLAAMSYASMVGHDLSTSRRAMVQGESVFVPLQLNNDTNIKVFSPRFRSADDFLEYVLEQVGDTRHVLVKPHPLDRDFARFENYARPNVEIVGTDVPVGKLLREVGHVVALNSTVLLEALNYRVNIYSGGLGLLDNKGVAASLVENDLKDVLQDELRGTMKDRAALIAAFQRRQINVSSLTERSLLEESVLDESLAPIAEALLSSRPKWPVLKPLVAPIPAKSPSPTPAAKAAPPSPIPAAKAAPPSPIPAAKAAPQLGYAELYKRGCQHFHAARYPQAAADLVKASTLPGSKPGTLRCAAEAHVRSGNTKAAIDLLEKAVQALPENKRVRGRLAYLKRPTFAQKFTSSYEFDVPKP